MSDARFDSASAAENIRFREEADSWELGFDSPHSFASRSGEKLPVPLASSVRCNNGEDEVPKAGVLPSKDFGADTVARSAVVMKY